MNRRSSRPTPRRRPTLAVVLTALLLGLNAPILSAAAAASTEGRQWAILIGVEKYHRASNLLYTVNDVEQIAHTLQHRGNYSEDCILKMVDTAPNARFQPLRKSILDELPLWLGKVKPEDRVLVYFTGHGFRGPDGSLYLAPIDCDPKNPAPTGVAVQWLRQQIVACKARFKLLVIDACHSGSEKGENQTPQVTAKDLIEPFEKVAGVVTLASSAATETSLIWPDVRQSLFSFWVNQALKGHADRDCDCAVTVHELYEFVERYVRETAKLVFGRSQTPRRIIGPDVPGVPVVIRLEPTTLKGTLEEMAGQLKTAIRLKGVTKVGVAEFSPRAADAETARLLGGSFGLLGRSCAEELERRLLRQVNAETGGGFTIVPHKDLHKTLSTDRYSIDDLHTSAARGLVVDNRPLPVIALGRFCLRTGRVITLQCDLVGTQSQETLATAGGTALLNESEWAMLGRSVAVKPGDHDASSSNSAVTAEVKIGAAIARLDSRAATKPHPVLDTAFPFRVKILVDGREREATVKDNDLYVPLSKGEVYQIRVETRARHRVLLRLLVDGLNTLPEKIQAKNVSLASKPPEAVYAAAHRVSLDDAQAWKLEPAPNDRQPRVYRITGFFSRTGENAVSNDFKVVDAAESLAASRQFTERIGLITAAFYAPRAGSRAVGTGRGAERRGRTDLYKATPVGKLLGVINIRYIEPEALERAQQ